MSDYTGFLFDYYGTLVHEDTEVISAIVRRIAARCPREADPRTIATTWERRFRDLMDASSGEAFRTQRELELSSLEQVLEATGVKLDAGELSEELYKYWRRPQPFEDALAFVAELDRPWAIVSNIDNDFIRESLTTLGLTTVEVVTSEDCRHYKPRAEPFLRGLTFLGMNPSEVLYVGDSLSSDYEGARNLGMDFAWINRNSRPFRGKGAGPTFDVDNFVELRTILGLGDP